MSVVRLLFRHPLEWFFATLIIGLVYGTAALVALKLGRSLHLALHTSVLAVLLVSAISAAVGNYVIWLDKRAGIRAEMAERSAQERAQWTVRRVRELSPTQQLPTLRAVGSAEPAAVSLPAQANRDRRATVTQLNPERLLGFWEGITASKEVTGEVYPGMDEEPSGDISREAT